MSKKDEIYIPEDVNNRDCIKYVIKHYHNIMKEQLKKALEPWRESIDNCPIQIIWNIGEYNE